MITLTLQEISDQTDGAVGTVQLLLDDPQQLVTDVWFDVIRVDGGGVEQSRVTVPADAVVAVGVFQVAVALDPTFRTHVAAHVHTDTGDVDAPGFIDLDPASLNDTVLANALSSAVATIDYWQLVLAISPGSASRWECWARANAWPTTDGTDTGPSDDSFLRIEGRRDDLGIDIGLGDFTGQSWYVISQGFSPNGTAGPRFTAVLPFTKDSGDVPLMQMKTIHTTAVERRKTEVLDSLSEFTDWLATNGEPGFFGEYGWPWTESDSWNEIGDAVLSAADAAQLWGTAWAVGELWGPSYPLQPFVKQNGVWVDEPQQTVLAAHETTPQYMRGLNFAGAEFGTPVDEPTSNFSNTNRGVHGVDYQWNGLGGDHPNVYEHAVSLGHVLARIPFRWERLQPELGGALDANEVNLMISSVNAAIAAGLSVILDCHNYGAYYVSDGTQGVRYSIGTPQVTYDDFANLWTRIAELFNGTDGVVGYGLMNEPVAMTPSAGLTAAQTWEAAAQAAVTAIRNVAVPAGHDPKWIMCAGYEWSGTWSLAAHHPAAFAGDPDNKTMYEGHLYFDADRSGRYQNLEFTPGYEIQWVQWTPNSSMWPWDSAPNDGSGAYTVELYRVGRPDRLQVVPLWYKGASEDHIAACTTPGSNGCAYQNYEYRVVAINRVDGSTIEFGAEISGAFIEQ